MKLMIIKLDHNFSYNCPAQEILSRIFSFRILFILLYVLLSATFLSAGTRITGIVTDLEGNPISDVNIELLSTTLGAVTTENGEFFLSRVSDGKYLLKFSHISYIEKIIEVNSYRSDAARLKVRLDPLVYELEPLACYSEQTVHGNKLTINTRDIEESNSSSVEEILLNNASLQVSRLDGINSRISIRGADSKQVTVMMDGVGMNSKMDGSFDLKSIPTDIIERIDVYKGGDIEFSSQAIGGVINIITKKNYFFKDPEFSLQSSSTGYYSNRDNGDLRKFNNQNVSLSSNFSCFGQNIMINYAVKDHQNDWSYIDASRINEINYINHQNLAVVRDNAHYQRKNLFCNVSGNYRALNYSYLFNHSLGYNGIPGWIDRTYEKANINSEDVKNRIKLGYVTKEDIHSFSLDLFNDHIERDIFIDEMSSFFYADYTDKYANRGYVFRYKGKSELVNISMGNEYEKDVVESKNLDGEKFREVSSTYLAFDKKVNFSSLGIKDTQQEQYLKLFGGARGEYVSTQKRVEDFYSLGLLAEFSFFDFTMLPKVKCETSFRLPTFSSLFWVDNAVSSGNPDLVPEYGRSREAVIHLSYHGFSFCDISSHFELYDKELENLIVWLKRSNGKYVPENLVGGEIFGTESGIDIDFWDNAVSVSCLFTTLDTKAKTDNHVTDGKQIIYKPLSTFSSSLKGTYKNWSGSINTVRTGTMHLHTSNRRPNHPFWLFGIHVSYEYKFWDDKKLKTFVNIENALDKQYQVVYSYPMPGRSIELGFKLNL